MRRLERHHHLIEEERLLEGDARSEAHAAGPTGLEIGDLRGQRLRVAQRPAGQAIQRFAGGSEMIRQRPPGIRRLK